MATKHAAPRKHEGPGVWDDLTHQADTLIAPNQWVTVDSGPNKGKYGVALDRTADGESAIIRTRDENNERLVEPFDNLSVSSEGRRPT